MGLPARVSSLHFAAVAAFLPIQDSYAAALCCGLLGLLWACSPAASLCSLARDSLVPGTRRGPGLICFCLVRPASVGGGSRRVLPPLQPLASRAVREHQTGRAFLLSAPYFCRWRLPERVTPTSVSGPQSSAGAPEGSSILWLFQRSTRALPSSHIPFWLDKPERGIITPRVHPPEQKNKIVVDTVEGPGGSNTGLFGYI